MNEKFAKERAEVLLAAHEGIKSNIPFSALQNKYIKNLLYFALMNATANETVTNKNFIKLVNKLFKGYFLKIIKQILDDDDGEFDTALDVSLNKIVADGAIIDIKKLANELSAAQIIALIKANVGGMSQKEVLKKIMSLRDMKMNHRETPQEQREREQRQKEYELARQRQRMMESRVLSRGERERR